MYKLQTVVPEDNYKIKAFFVDGKVVLFDMKPLIDESPKYAVMKQNETLFESASVSPNGDMIFWTEDLTLDAGIVYANGVWLEIPPQTPAINRLLAYNLRMTRKKVGLTQSELSKKTGISQADISRIERGVANPSLDTLNRLAEGLEMELSIEFQLKVLEGYQDMLEGRVVSLEEVKERTRKRWEERGYGDIF